MWLNILMVLSDPVELSFVRCRLRSNCHRYVHQYLVLALWLQLPQRRRRRLLLLPLLLYEQLLVALGVASRPTLLVWHFPDPHPDKWLECMLDHNLESGHKKNIYLDQNWCEIKKIPRIPDIPHTCTHIGAPMPSSYLINHEHSYPKELTYVQLIAQSSKSDH